jgi:glycosyltransferase involved in cell wall biosynthesis
MKIFTLKANENWFCDRYRSEWAQHAGENIHTENPNEADILWLLPSWQWKVIPPYFLKNKRTVATVHHIVPEKFNYLEFKQRDHYIDYYHVPCEQTKRNISPYTKKPIKIIEYWLNTDLWTPLDKKQSRLNLDIPQDEFVIGSFQRDTEGSDLISPKLEKGPDLFVEYVKKMDKKNLRILLGGWRRQYIIKRLEEEKINLTYVEMAPYEKLKKMYAACDLYIVSSRYEGGPQAVLEAPAMKIPIISSNVGMASAVLNDNCIIDVHNDMYCPTEEDVEECYKNALKYDIKKHVQKYIDFFKEIE